MDEYAQAKAKIFAAQTEDDYAVFNIEDGMVQKHVQYKPLKVRRIPFTTSGPIPYGFYRFDGELWADGDGIEEQFLIKANEVPMPGDHNVANVLAAAAITLAFKVDVEAVRSAVKSFRGVAHRMEFVAEVAGVRYINNSMCTNPAAVEASVSAIVTPLVAIAGGIHKGGDLTPMYESLKRNARKVVLIGAAKQEIADGLRVAGMDAGDVSFADSLGDAVTMATELATVGDTVMLVPGCASFDMFSGFEERGAVFRGAVRSMSPLSPRPFPPADGGERGARSAEVLSAGETFVPPASGAPLSPPSAGGKGRGDRGDSED